MTFVISGKILVDGQQAKFELAATAAEIAKLRGGQQALSAAAAQGTTALQAQINTLTGVRAGFSSAASSAAAFTEAMDARDEFNALRASVDPLFASSQRLAQAQEIVARAIEKGGIEASQAAALLDMYEAQLAGVQMSSGQASAAVGNMTAQFNDIFMMVAAGQNPMQLAIQQGTQITQAFGNAGAAGALRLMGAGLVSMLSPLNLVMIGGIAAGAALVQWFMDAGEQAQTLEGALGELEASIGDLREVTGLLAATDLSGLREEFGEISVEVLRLLELQRQFAVADAMRASSEALAASVSSMKGWITSELEGISRAFGLGQDEAYQLLAAIERAKQAATPEEALQRVIAVRQQIESLAGPLTELSGPTYEMARGLVEAEANLRRVVTEAERAEERLGAGVDKLAALNAGSPGSGWMSTAIGETNALISRLMAANQAMDALRAGGGMASGPAPAPGVPSGLGIGVDTIFGNVPPALGGTAPMDSSRRPQQRPIDFLPGDGAGVGSGSGSGSGRTAATRSETSAVERLIERRTEELELLRETDPVSREMIRNRELLATATEAQRAQIEEVTAALEREKAVQAASDFFSSEASDFLTSIVTGSESASDALDNLIDKLIDAGIQALMLGEGPLAGLFGATGTGIFDVVGGLFGGGGGTGAFGLPLPFADGGGIGERTGMIYGQGGPRDDKELILASPGEFMVNARATARHRDLLEVLNSGGDLPRFADGGMVGMRRGPFDDLRVERPAEGGTDGLRIDLNMPISIDARGSERGVEDRIEARLAELVPGIVKKAVDDAVAKVADKMGRGGLR